MGNFVHLHLHSEYSLLDGAVRLTQQVFKRDDEGKMKASTAYPLAEALKARGMDAFIFPSSSLLNTCCVRRTAPSSKLYSL